MHLDSHIIADTGIVETSYTKVWPLSLIQNSSEAAAASYCNCCFHCLTDSLSRITPDFVRFPRGEALHFTVIFDFFHAPVP